MSEPKLYLIATPLGNINDITLRALECFKRLEFFFAEDTRELGKLMGLCGVDLAGKKLFSYASHNMKEATEKALQLLTEGKEVGFATDRGTPGISDPGFLLVRQARKQGVAVIPVPGPSSVTTLLSVSGMPSDRFLFLGFLSQKESERKATFELMRTVGVPSCFFESARRIKATLEELVKEFPTGTVFLGREMTKLFESYHSIALAELDLATVVEKGEYAIALDPGPPVQAEEDWRKEVALRLVPDKEWAKQIARRYDLSASEIYNALQREKSAQRDAGSL